MFILKHMGKQDLLECAAATVWISGTSMPVLGEKFCCLSYL